MANGLDPSLEKFRDQDNLDDSNIKPHKKAAMKGAAEVSASDPFPGVTRGQ